MKKKGNPWHVMKLSALCKQLSVSANWRISAAEELRVFEKKSMRPKRATVDSRHDWIISTHTFSRMTKEKRWMCEWPKFYSMMIMEFSWTQSACKTCGLNWTEPPATQRNEQSNFRRYVCWAPDFQKNTESAQKSECLNFFLRSE